MDLNWYWKNGLHDAVIKEVNFIELLYDYTQKDPIRNYFEIILDAKNALYDFKVKSIRLYNYKLLNSFGRIDGFWWVSDTVSEINGKILLTINVSSAKESKEIKVIFEKAEVIREN